MARHGLPEPPPGSWRGPVLRTRALLAALALALLAVPGAAQDAGRLLFRAKVSDLWLQTSFYAKNKGLGDCVEIALPGRIEPAPVSVGLIERKAADWSTPAGAMASIRSANTAADRGWILENFVAEEQASLRPLLDDAALVRRNQEHYQAIRKVEILGSAELRGYTLVLTREELPEGRARVVPIALVRTQAGWRQTNALLDDVTFDVVWAALRANHVRGRTLGSC